MKRCTAVALLASALALSACSDRTALTGPEPQFGLTSGPAVTVLSRNLYLGANIDPLITPGADPGQAIADAIEQLSYTYYPARAARIAAEIQQRQPALVGLQEVTKYDFSAGTGITDYDFLDVLLLYLGAAYTIGVRQDNVIITLPLGGGQSVTYTDGDAILVRSGIDFSGAAHGHFENQVHLTVGGQSFDNLRGWVAVTAELNDRSYRFYNTHLEIQAFREVQEAQAREVASLTSAETLPVILVGDFNSAANHDAPVGSKTASYDILRRAGLIDLWIREPHSVGGLTCCQDADLSNTASDLDQRLDIVWVRNGRNGFGGQSSVQVFGNTDDDVFSYDPPANPLGDPPAYTLWPSDHAGVFASIWFAPGQIRK